MVSLSLEEKVARRNDVTEGISANFKANKTLFFDNLSVKLDFKF